MAKTTTRIPMPIRMRAKQFAMFDALKGLTEAIAEKEQETIQRHELAEDRIQEINEELVKLNCGDRIIVTYYCYYGNQCKTLIGTLRRVDTFGRKIQVDETSISFSDIVLISIAT